MIFFFACNNYRLETNVSLTSPPRKFHGIFPNSFILTCLRKGERKHVRAVPSIFCCEVLYFGEMEKHKNWKRSSLNCDTRCEVFKNRAGTLFNGRGDRASEWTKAWRNNYCWSINFHYLEWGLNLNWMLGNLTRLGTVSVLCVRMKSGSTCMETAFLALGDSLCALSSRINNEGSRNCLLPNKFPINVSFMKRWIRKDNKEKICKNWHSAWSYFRANKLSILVLHVESGEDCGLELDDKTSRNQQCAEVVIIKLFVGTFFVIPQQEAPISWNVFRPQISAALTTALHNNHHSSLWRFELWLVKSFSAVSWICRFCSFPHEKHQISSFVSHLREKASVSKTISR